MTALQLGYIIPVSSSLVAMPILHPCLPVCKNKAATDFPGLIKTV